MKLIWYLLPHCRFRTTEIATQVKANDHPVQTESVQTEGAEPQPNWIHGPPVRSDQEYESSPDRTEKADHRESSRIQSPQSTADRPDEQTPVLSARQPAADSDGSCAPDRGCRPSDAAPGCPDPYHNGPGPMTELPALSAPVQEN